MIERVVARVAPSQHGLVTRTQLLDADVPRRTIDNFVAAERLERVHSAVFLVPGAPRTWRQSVLAATLSAGPEAAAAELTAAALWDLLPIPRSPIEIVVPVTRNPKADGFVVHRSRRPIDAVVVDGVPTTSPARTIEDLSRRLPVGRLEDVVDKALYRRLVTPDDLRIPAGPLGRLMSDRGVVESPLEAQFLRLLRDGGLPLPVPQFEIRRGGILIARVDFAYVRERIVIELESYQYHSGRGAFDRGNQRFKELQAAGYLVLPFTSTDTRRPKQVIATVRRCLWERGHPDVVHA